MKKTLFVICLVLFCIPYMQSQNFTVTGKVVDALTKDPLEFATVTFKPKNNKDIVGAITDDKGKFDIVVPKGKYTVIVEYLAYKTITFKSQDINSSQHYGSIELSEDPEVIETIVIEGKKKLLELKPKKMVYHVTEDIASEGSAIADVLNNIPSVSMSDGVATIRGQEATIMINGKMSSLSKADVIKSLPSGSVEDVEVITSPGAEYSSEYKSILNIIMKKGKNNGLNASVTGTGGYLDIYGGLVTLNNKSEKVNFYATISYGHNNQIITSNAKTKYFTGGVINSYLNENSEFSSHNSNFIGSIGADYYLSKSTTLTGSITYTDLDDKSRTLTNSSFLDATQLETASNIRNHTRIFDDEAIELTAEIEHNFKKEGRKLTSYIKYLDNIEDENTQVVNSNGSFTDEFFTQDNKLINTTFDIKYKTPVTKNTVLIVGYNGNFGKIPFRNSIANKNLDYIQDVHAVFARYEYEKGAFYIDGGLRGEFDNTSINYLDLNVFQNRKLNDFFPSIYSQYAISDSKTIILDHRRNLSRPNYASLQPFEQKFSETSSYIGNESLKPIYSDVIQLTYSYYGDKISLIPSLFFQKWSDYWQEVTYETGEQINGANKFITTPQNVGFVNYYGIDFTATYRASNALNFTFNTILYNFDQHGVFNTTNTLNQPISIDFNKQSFNGNFKLSTQIKLPYKINFQTNIFHNLKSEGPVSTRKAYTYASLSMNKKLMNKKATLTLNINDVFNSKQTDRDRFSVDYFSNSLIKNKYTDITLSFTYRFNKSKNNKKVNFKGKDKKPNY